LALGSYRLGVNWPERVMGDAYNFTTTSKDLRSEKMGIFGNDEQQDKRLDALEQHLRELTQTVQTNQVDLAETRISLLGLQARIDEKVSISDVDPMIIKLNEELDIARKELEKSSAAASESWTTLQGGVSEAFEMLRKSVRQASEKIEKS
jgi:hypothetical protein